MIQPNNIGYKLSLSMMHFIFFEHGVYNSKILKQKFKIGYN